MPNIKEQLRGFIKARNSSDGCRAVLSCGSMENVCPSYIAAAQNLMVSDLRSGIGEECPLVRHLLTIVIDDRTDND